ncbi:MAG: collagen binding domain-containing protein, partial [Lachnospiraceae bacterium]
MRKRKQKIKGKIRKVASLAVACALLMPSNMTSIAATLFRTDSDGAAEMSCTDTSAYIAEVLDTELVAEAADISKDELGDIKLTSTEIKKEADRNGLTPTYHTLHVNYSLADASMISEGETIDSLYETKPESFIGSYGFNTPIYATEGNEDCFLAFVDPSIINGTGKTIDVAFTDTDAFAPIVLNESIRYDRESGLVYIPKSLYFDKEGNETVFSLQAQVLVAYDFSCTTTEIPVHIDNQNTQVVQVAEIQSLCAATLDVTTTIPLVTSETAANLNLDKVKIYLNDNDEAVVLDEESYYYDTETGNLTLAVAPLTLYSIHIVIEKDTWMEKISSVLSNLFGALNVKADSSISNADEVGLLPDTLLENLDLSTLKVGQLYTYTGFCQYYAFSGDVTVDEQGEPIAWPADAINHTYKYCYFYTNDGYEEMYSILNQEISFDELLNQSSAEGYPLSLGTNDTSAVYFPMVIDPPHGVLTATDGTVQNFGTLTEDWNRNDSVYAEAAQRLALHCSHTTTPISTVSSTSTTAAMYARILHIDADDGYIILSLLTPMKEWQKQAGNGIYKVAVVTKKEGTLTLQKVSDNINITSNNDNYSLAGAEYDVYLDFACTTKVGTLTTKSDGNSDTLVLEEGTYYVKETKASAGYLLDDTVHEVVVERDKNTAVISTEPVATGSIHLKKMSDYPEITVGNQCYSLAGAEYEVYSDEAYKNKVATLVTDENGNTNTVSVGVGTYYVKETKASRGFLLDKNSYEVTVTAGQTTTITSTERMGSDSMYFELTKEDARGMMQSTASLEGAEFTIHYYDGYYSSVDELPESPKNSWVIKTVEINGKYIAQMAEQYLVSGELYVNHSGEVFLPLGTYTIQETKAPNGYFLSGTMKFKNSSQELRVGSDVLLTQVTIHDGVISMADSNEIEVREDIICGKLILQKNDADSKTAIPQGDAILENASYSIINKNTGSVAVDRDGDGIISSQEIFAPNEVVYVMTVGADGIAQTSENFLPYGTYEIVESTASTGYLNTTERGGVVSATITISEPQQIVELNQTFYEPVIRGGFSFQKRDMETSEDVALGGAALGGGTYTITTMNSQDVWIDSDGDGTLECFEPEDIVLTFHTNADGYYESSKTLLPYGTYKLTETVAPNGYLRLGTIEWTFTIREEGVIVDLTHTLYNYVKRGDLYFHKRNAETGEAMAYIPFKITALDKNGNEIESHIVYTDENGDFNSNNQYVLHSYKTNAGDSGYEEYLVNYEETGVYAENDNTIGRVGTWFGVNTHVENDLRLDATGAFPYGVYVIEELPCETNEGMRLVKDTFVISKELATTTLFIDQGGYMYGSMSGLV